MQTNVIADLVPISLSGAYESPLSLKDKLCEAGMWVVSTVYSDSVCVVVDYTYETVDPLPELLVGTGWKRDGH